MCQSKMIKMKMTRLSAAAGIFLAALVISSSCQKSENRTEPQKRETRATDNDAQKQETTAVTEKKVVTGQGNTKKTDTPQVTLIELGSVRCVPCKMMTPILAEVEKEYAGKVKVVFYDVWTPEGREKAAPYRIRVIPTQVFLDHKGNEYFRHEGFFAKTDLVKVLRQKLK